MADANVPENMTVVNGVRVRKEEEKEFRTRHKAVLAPQGGAVSAAPPKAKVARSKLAESGDDS